MNYEQAKRGYLNLWTAAQIRPERRMAAQTIAQRLNMSRERYEAVARRVRAPWPWVAIVNSLEGGGRFTGHLHNGDPLTRRTTHVPRGRPLTGTPPFTWEESAVDALEMEGIADVPDWPVARWGFEWEKYNGWGYTKLSQPINSPYLWSFTTAYGAAPNVGKYVADGRFNSSAISEQCGAIAILKAMIELGITKVPDTILTLAQMQAIAIDKPVSPIIRLPVKTPEWDIAGIVFNFITRLFT